MDVCGAISRGHASLATAEYANTDATYKGAVAGAPASSLGQIILEVAPAALAGIEEQELNLVYLWLHVLRSTLMQPYWLMQH